MFKDEDFIPVTVFSIEDCKNLEFPIIAKPASGKSAKGIVKFDNIEELKKSKDKFDLYSEAIDIKREFRCFCFKKNIMEIDERIKIEGAKDFLKDANTETDFYYKTVSLEKYDKKEDLLNILNICKKLTDLDFYSLDFAEDTSGKLYIIEINSRTGMGVPKMAKLYKYIYEDYYNKSLDDKTETYLNTAIQEWKKQYKEQNDHISECINIAGIINNNSFLFKNRDRSFTPDTKVIHEKYKGVEIVYYTDQSGWVEGMNEFGLGVVFSKLDNKVYNSYKQTYAVSDEPKTLKTPVKYSNTIKDLLIIKNLDDAIEKLKKENKPGSYLIGDSKEIYEVEIFENEFKKRKLDFTVKNIYAKTNHGTLLPHAGHQDNGISIKRSISQIRKHQAESQLFGVDSLLDIAPRMKVQVFDSNSPLNTFRTDNEEYTVGQCLMVLSELQFYFYHDKLTADSVKLEDNIKDGKIKIDIRKI